MSAHDTNECLTCKHVGVGYCDSHRSVAAAPKAGAKWFPLLGTPFAIRRDLLNEETAQQFHYQSLDRLAERGGLAPNEAWANVSKDRGALNRSQKEAFAALIAAAPTPPASQGDAAWPEVGSMWLHANGSRYTVTGHANDDSSRADYPPVVLYRGEDGRHWAKPLAEWHRSRTLIAQDDAAPAGEAVWELVVEAIEDVGRGADVYIASKIVAKKIIEAIAAAPAPAVEREACQECKGYEAQGVFCAACGTDWSEQGRVCKTCKNTPRTDSDFCTPCEDAGMTEVSPPAEAREPAADGNGGAVDALGRFGHHPDPANDFCIEVETLEARLINARLGFNKAGLEPETVEAVQRDIEHALKFRVGGDPIAVRAMGELRALAARTKEST